MARSPGNLCDSAELTCTALDARARVHSPAFSGACARCSRSRMRMPCTPGSFGVLVLKTQKSPRWNRGCAIGVACDDARKKSGKRGEQSGAGEARGKAEFPPAVAPPKHIRSQDQISFLLEVAPRVRADASICAIRHGVDPVTRDVLSAWKESGVSK